MLSSEEVLKIAKLAKLSLSDVEVAKLQKLLSEALEYSKVLDELDTAAVKPTNSVNGLINVFHEDQSISGLPQNKALANAKEKKEGYFATGAVLKKHL